MRFENTFWTSDYISGIKALLDTLEKSRRDGLDSLQYFKSYVDLLEIESTKLKELSIKSGKLLGSREKEIASPKILGEFEQNHTSLGSLTRLKRVQSEHTNTISEGKSSLALKIQSDLIIRLQDFLDDFQDFISDSDKSLTNQYNAYIKATQQAIAAEKSYINKTRELEDVGLKESQNNLIEPSKEKSEAPIQKTVEQVEDDQEDEIFKFPMRVGTTIFKTIEELNEFMVSMTDEIPIKRRMIPIPGINNEYWSSESFFKWVRSNKENEDSRRKIEQFGQDLITLGLISNWNKLAANKFISDDGYYEFTDLARYIVKFDGEKVPTLEVTPSEETIEHSHPKNSVFDGLKNRFKQNLDIETLRQNSAEAKEKYLESVDKSYLEKGILETSIISVCRRAEVYETNHTKLVYFLTKCFNELVLDEHQKQLDIIQDIADDYIYNDDTLAYELLKKSINNKTGWFWPKSDVKFSNYGNSKSTANLELFGNDLLNQYRDLSTGDLKTKSVPFFLKKIILYLDELEGVDEAWVKELDVLKASNIKRSILSSIPIYEKQYSPDDLDVDINYFVTSKVASEVISKSSADDVVSFLKLWLLELPDSLIPFTAYDQLRTCYLENSGDDSMKVKILGSIPRQNLASLLYLMEHITSKVTSGEKLVKNEKVPLYHLLIRPSPKLQHANTDDLIVFEPFCNDLLKKDFQTLLYGKLNELEQTHLEREKRAEESLQRLKQVPRELSPPRPISKSTSSNSLTVDGLRPFKTKSPLTSPVSSPKVGRSRTNSNLFSPLRRPSDSLHKRTLSKNLDKETLKHDETTKNNDKNEARSADKNTEEMVQTKNIKEQDKITSAVDGDEVEVIEAGIGEENIKK